MVNPDTGTFRATVTRSFTVPLPVLALALAVVITVSMLVGGTAAWAFARERVPEVVRGTVTGMNEDVSVIGFRADGSRGAPDGVGRLNGGEMMSLLAGVSWTDTDGTVHHGTPVRCLDPRSRGQRVELRIVEYRSGGSSKTIKVVVAIRCLPR